MKNFFKILIAISAITLFAIACNKEDNATTKEVELNYKAQMMDYQTYLELKKKEVKREVYVEHASIEEVNQIFIEAGLNPLPQRHARSACSRVIDCYIWPQWGDWSGNDTISTLDLVLALDYICNYNTYDCDKSIYIYSGSHPYAAYDFAGMTNLCESAWELDYLNENDVWVGQQFVLLNVDCDP